MQQKYFFNKTTFDKNGTNENGVLFSDLIRNWELVFHQYYDPFYANHLYANISTMFLLKSCYDSGELEDFGMDGAYDLETNLKIEKYSKRCTIYALGSEIAGNKGEALYLVIDENMKDGTIILKHISEDDGGNLLSDMPVKKTHLNH